MCCASKISRSFSPTKSITARSSRREATAWLTANPQEGWAEFAKQGKEVANELNRRAWKDTLPLLARDPAAVDAARYETFSTFLQQRGLLKKPAPVRDYIRDLR